jgi:hypothetical protein
VAKNWKPSSTLLAYLFAYLVEGTHYQIGFESLDELEEVLFESEFI